LNNVDELVAAAKSAGLSPPYAVESYDEVSAPEVWREKILLDEEVQSYAFATGLFCFASLSGKYFCFIAQRKVGRTSPVSYVPTG
jgi:hypothetical protein